MATFETIQNEVIARLGNRTDIGTRSSMWMNDALYELAHNPRFSFRELDTSHTFILEQFITNYDLTPVPAFWFPLYIFITLADANHRVHAKVLEDLMEIQGSATGRPLWYAMAPNNSIQIWPGANAQFTGSGMVMFYRKRLDVFSEGTTFPLGREWEEAETVLSVIKGLEALQRFEEAGVHRQIFENITSARMAHLELEEPMYETTIGVRFD